MDFDYIEVEKYSTVFHLWEDTNKDYRLTDVLEIRFLELPKFRKKQPDLSQSLDRWMIFIEDSPEEVLEMAKKAEPAIEKAEKILENLGSFDAIRRYYEAREIAIHDEISRITGAREEGMVEGRAEGRAEGRVEGQREMSLQIAKSLLGILDDYTISEKAGLTLEEVRSLKLQ